MRPRRLRARRAQRAAARSARQLQLHRALAPPQLITVYEEDADDDELVVGLDGKKRLRVRAFGVHAQNMLTRRATSRLSRGCARRTW